TGMHDRGSMTDLERALFQSGFRVEDIRLLVITHAHADHCGQAPSIAERAGCEVWMHPAWALHTGDHLERNIGIARRGGVPEEAIERAAVRREESGSGIAGTLRADRDLVEGVEFDTDLGPWAIVETPGHAPSHVCLHQPERRLLISGDHLL